MPRSKITSASKDLITDDGAILISMVEGEQIRLNLTIGWVVNLSGYTITSKIIEGDNTQDSGTKPNNIRSGGVITELTIIDTDPTDNIFDIVIPEDLIDSWNTYPIPDKPIYGFIGLEIKDTGVGDNQQIWKPMRGLIEIRYSPTEEV